MTRPYRRERGQSAVEFALIAVIFILLVFGILEAGRLFFAYSSISNAAREGTRYGITDPANTNGIRSIVIARGVGLNLTSANVAVSPAPSDGWSVGRPITVTVTYNFQPIIGGILPNFTMDTSSSMIVESVP